MAEEIKVETTRRETIKPSSPTPQHLGIVKLSWLDQFSPETYVSIILFYPFITTSKHSPTPQNPTQIASERLLSLRETLSKTLALYYPFAGRLRDNFAVECNDEGVEFVEAKASFPMSKVLKNPDRVGVLKSFLGASPESSLDSHGGSLLVVQATLFICGGISLAINLSHKLADACTIGTFINTWAKMSRGNPNELNLEKPEFGQGCDIFPPSPPEFSSAKTSSIELVQENCVTKRCVFTAEKIASLKSKLKNNPTRVEAVSSLLWKCATKASSSSRASVWFLSMNLRKRISPPFGNNTAGNIVAGLTAKMHHHEQEEANLHQVMADKIRKGIEEASGSYSDKKLVFKNVQGFIQEVVREMKSDEAEFFRCTSWCRFGLYEADFGWEKPAWVGLVTLLGYKNFVVLMDTKDGYGIEAWLVFKEEDMAVIETDPELLDFASLNPSVL